MIERRDAMLMLVGTIVALNTMVITFNSYRLTIMRIESEVHRTDDRLWKEDVSSLKEWRKLTQSNRFTSEHGAQLRNDMEIYVAALAARIEMLERERNERQPP